MLTLPQNIICGYCDCSEFGTLTYSPKRKVAKYEIEFYLEDAYSTFADTREYKIQKNFIQIAKPGQIRYSRLPFSTAYIKFEVTDEIAEMLSKTCEYFPCSHPEEVRQKIDEIILLNESYNKNQLLLQSRILSLINLILLDSEISESNMETNYTVISAAKRFIEHHSGEKIKLCHIAKSVNLSEIYFHNNFTLATGTTPHQYLTVCRLENAKKLLWNTKIPMCDIAEKCGFCSQQHFSKVFKKEIGMTPNQYRKSFQKKYLF